MNHHGLDPRLHLITFVVTACASIANCEDASARRLVVVDGDTVSATIEALKPDWSLAVRTDGEQKEVAPTDYVLWGGYADRDHPSQVLLTDGTVLVGDIVRIETGSVTIVSRLWSEVRLDRGLIRACLMLPATDPLERDRQWRSLQQSEPGDRVLLLNGDAITGKLLPTTERDGEGLFGLVSLGIELSGSGSRTSVMLEEVQAITFETSVEPTVRPECLLGFHDGSLVAASTLTTDELDLKQIETVAGASLQLRTGDFLKHLTFVQPKNETVTYLSDLPAIGYKSLPFLTLDWPLGIATNTLGGRLRSDGSVSFMGLGMHSTSRVAYELDGDYKRFQAELALDDHAGRHGSVVYRILVERNDESEQRSWDLAYTSPIIRGGGGAPRSISVDVSNATRVALVVEMADRADTRDYANWLNARLLR